MAGRSTWTIFMAGITVLGEILQRQRLSSHLATAMLHYGSRKHLHQGDISSLTKAEEYNKKERARGGGKGHRIEKGTFLEFYR